MPLHQSRLVQSLCVCDNQGAVGSHRLSEALRFLFANHVLGGEISKLEASVRMCIRGCLRSMAYMRPKEGLENRARELKFEV